jgi:hypothetical protein
MTTEIEFSEVPSFAKIAERVKASNQNIEFVKAGLDGLRGSYVLRLRLKRTASTDLRLSRELLEDLTGKNTTHRYDQLDMEIRRAVDRLQ